MGRVQAVIPYPGRQPKAQRLEESSRETTAIDEKDHLAVSKPSFVIPTILVTPPPANANPFRKRPIYPSPDWVKSPNLLTVPVTFHVPCLDSEWASAHAHAHGKSPARHHHHQRQSRQEDAEGSYWWTFVVLLVIFLISNSVRTMCQQPDPAIMSSEHAVHPYRYRHETYGPNGVIQEGNLRGYAADGDENNRLSHDRWTSLFTLKWTLPSFITQAMQLEEWSRSSGASSQLQSAPDDEFAKDRRGSVLGVLGLSYLPPSRGHAWYELGRVAGHAELQFEHDNK